MKRTIRFLNLILTCLMVVCSFSVVFAEAEAPTPANPLDSMKPNWGKGGSVVPLANKVVGALEIIGYFIAAGMMVMIGVKYIHASADEKADVKSAFPKYLIGAILIVFAVEIIGLVFNSMGAGG